METIKLLEKFDNLYNLLKLQGDNSPIIDHVENDPHAYSDTEEAIEYLQMVFDAN